MSNLEELAERVTKAERIAEQAHETVTEAQALLLDAQQAKAHADQELIDAKHNLLTYLKQRDNHENT